MLSWLTSIIARSLPKTFEAQSNRLLSLETIQICFRTGIRLRGFLCRECILFPSINKRRARGHFLSTFCKNSFLLSLRTRKVEISQLTRGRSRFSRNSGATPSYLTLAPAATSRSKKGIMALPPVSAARSMAWDSIPRITAGFKLTMTMSFFPTISSGE